MPHRCRWLTCEELLGERFSVDATVSVPKNGCHTCLIGVCPPTRHMCKMSFKTLSCTHDSPKKFAAFAVVERATAVCLPPITPDDLHHALRIPERHSRFEMQPGVPPWNNERCERDPKWLIASVNPKPIAGSHNMWHPPSRQVRDGCDRR